MKNGIWWIIGVIVLFFLLIVLYVNWPTKNGNRSNGSNSTEMVTANGAEVANLKALLTNRDAALVQANQTIALLAECCGSNKTVTYTKPAAPRNTGGSTNTGNTVKRFVPAPTGTGTETVIEGNKMPRAKRSMLKGEIEVCWRFGPNVYYPYIAIQENNIQFSNLVDNGKEGNNLAFMPSGTIGSTGESCGVTKDYTHWLRVTEAQKYQTWITFDIPQAMIEGVFLPATLVEVNGEQFFVVTALDYQKWISQTRGQ